MLAYAVRVKPPRCSTAGSAKPAADTRPRLIPPQNPPTPAATESVAEFLARGGAIEHLDQGARGQPVMRPRRTGIRRSGRPSNCSGPPDARSATSVRFLGGVTLVEGFPRESNYG